MKVKDAYVALAQLDPTADLKIETEDGVINILGFYTEDGDVYASWQYA